jgi:predicted ester cyclase
MESKNVQIVRESIEQISNAKRFDRIFDYYSEQCLFHTPPYVGLGLFPDETSGERLVIKSVAANGPAAGKVQIGDELLRASDANSTWEGYDSLRTGLWGQGKLGTEVTLTLLRDGETLDVTMARGRVEGFDSTLADALPDWKYYLTEVMPDLHTEINQIIADGDFVAYFSTNTGTSNTYHQSAVWTESGILRLENSKIVETWVVEDQLSMWRQFGFRIQEPGT